VRRALLSLEVIAHRVAPVATKSTSASKKKAIDRAPKVALIVNLPIVPSLNGYLQTTPRCGKID
jgi:hypothetical protein